MCDRDEPTISPRQCGGWIAVAPRRCQFRIAVTADTKDEAELAFSYALARWRENLLGDTGTQLPSVKGSTDGAV